MISRTKSYYLLTNLNQFNSYVLYPQINLFKLLLKFQFEKIYFLTIWLLCLIFINLRLFGDVYIFLNVLCDSEFGGSGGDHQSGNRQTVLRRIWNSWVPIPAGVGLTLLAVLQWRRIQRRNSKGEVRIAKDWEVECYRLLPLRCFSRAFGWVSDCTLPQSFRPTLYGSYSRMFGVNVAEISMPMESYPSLSDFFCRQLKDGCRPIDKHDIVSPADGRVLTVGKICSCRLEQVKGVTYNIKAFLGPALPVTSGQYIGTSISNVRFASDISPPDPDWCQYRSQLMHNKDNDIYQVVVYLGPGDYHRFHAPTDIDVYHRRHFQGDLLSVNPRIAAWVPGLFNLNERAVYFGSWRHGFFSFTAVGATNVGSIRVYQDKGLHTNERKWRDGTREREVPLNMSWKKGEEIGEFRMGSTVVLIFEAPKGFKLGLEPGDRVRVGQSLINSVNLSQSISGTDQTVHRANA